MNNDILNKRKTLSTSQVQGLRFEDESDSTDTSRLYTSPIRQIIKFTKFQMKPLPNDLFIKQKNALINIQIDYFVAIIQFLNQVSEEMSYQTLLRDYLILMMLEEFVQEKTIKFDIRYINHQMNLFIQSLNLYYKLMKNIKQVENGYCIDKNMFFCSQSVSLNL